MISWVLLIDYVIGVLLERNMGFFEMQCLPSLRRVHGFMSADPAYIPLLPIYHHRIGIGGGGKRVGIGGGGKRVGIGGGGKRVGGGRKRIGIGGGGKRGWHWFFPPLFLFFFISVSILARNSFLL
jgi:hypothetical protein